MAGKPRPAFFIVVALVVLGLVGFALFRMGILAPEGKKQGPVGKIDKKVEIEPKQAIFRIHKDVRFSKDKTPYKLNTGTPFTVKTRTGATVSTASQISMMTGMNAFW